MLRVISSVYESCLSLRESEIKRLASSQAKFRESESVNDNGMYLIIILLVRRDYVSNTTKSNYDSKGCKKIKVLKYSNIEYAKDNSFAKERHINTNKSQGRQKSQTSAGFSIEDRKSDLEKFKITNNRLKYNSNKINDFVDDDMDISYQNNYNSPNIKNTGAHKILSRMSNPSVIHKEGESIVPPLALKNIGSSKNTQNNTTGKMTRTTMHTTQIRDKMALNNLKNITTGKSNQKSNADCK